MVIIRCAMGFWESSRTRKRKKKKKKLGSFENLHRHGKEKGKKQKGRHLAGVGDPNP